MADPLHNRDFPELGTRTTDPVGTGVEENRDDTVTYEAPLEDPIRKGEMYESSTLENAGNPRLNRTAEQIGTALGKTVSQVKRAPETARRGLHVVRNRAQEAQSNATDQLSSSASSLADTAQQRAREFASTAQQRARELADTTKRRAGELADAAEERGRVLLDKADELSDRVAERGKELRDQLEARTREARAQARLKAQQARLQSERLIQEKPLHVLGGIAAAAFLLGVSLRIVRSRNASRY
jgi:ElaB/YqjD/DUF883 family membrane-anchored ribosome-binding protein